MKRGFAGLLICVLALCVTTITAFSTVEKNDMPVNIMAAGSGRPQDLAVIRYKGKTVNRATSRVEVSVEPNSMSRSNTAFSLEADEFVTISCTYSPKTSDVDLGLITPRNTFLYLSGADGHFYETIQVNESGLYYFAIRNNTDRAIEVPGYVYF